MSSRIYPGYFHTGQRLTASDLNEIVARLVKAESRIVIERSKWCHHCGAPWDWARPTCRWCGTSRPPEAE